jgi:triacylglycerol lipase
VAHVDRPDGGGDDGSALPVGARSLLGLLTSLPGRRDGAMAVVNGLFGDALDERDSPLATPMTVRAGAVVLPLERGTRRAALAEALPDASPRICLLVHGLMSTESVWRFPTDASTTYGTLLARDHGVTALSLRYNTGRHISSNGRDLAEILNWLMRAWPVPVREINLIGHSMGGLVVRSACHYARSVHPRGRRLPFGRRWTSKVRRVVLIGAPNTGAPLEVVVNMISAAPHHIPLGCFGCDMLDFSPSPEPSPPIPNTRWPRSSAMPSSPPPAPADSLGKASMNCSPTRPDTSSPR